jgi:hypothetical protein
MHKIPDKIPILNSVTLFLLIMVKKIQKSNINGLDFSRPQTTKKPTRDYYHNWWGQNPMAEDTIRYGKLIMAIEWSRNIQFFGLESFSELILFVL